MSGHWPVIYLNANVCEINEMEREEKKQFRKENENDVNFFGQRVAVPH